MLTCKDVSRLASEARDRRLSLAEGLGMKLHLWICGNCRRFVAHLNLLGAALRRQESGDDPLCGRHAPALSDAARERIRRALRGN